MSRLLALYDRLPDPLAALALEAVVMAAALAYFTALLLILTRA